MMPSIFTVMCGSLVLAPILILIAVVLFVRKRFTAGIVMILLSAAAFVLCLLPMGVYLARVGPSAPGDANAVNIVDDFVHVRYGGVWTLESTGKSTSFEDFDHMEVNDEFILLVEGDPDAPASIRLVSRQAGTARASPFDADSDRTAADRWLAEERGPPLADLRSSESVQWSWALFGQP